MPTRTRSGAIFWLGPLALLLVALPFFAATTFVGDDYLFLAFSRFEPNPLSAFLRDKHGGEYYRPLPMVVWWVLGRLAGSAAWPFALLALLLHAAAAVLLLSLVTALGRGRRAAMLAATFFFLSPATRGAALWFSASTDLLATVATLGSLCLLVRGRALRSLAAAAAAVLCKESSAVVPLLALCALRADPGRGSWLGSARRVLPHAGIVLGAFAIRWRILGGLGGSGDERAPFAGRLLQLASGVVHSVTAHDLLPEWMAWTIGLAVLASCSSVSWRAARRGDRAAIAPLAWIGLALLPLLAAGWVVGDRYFYLPAVGIAWMVGECAAGVEWRERTRALALVSLAGMGLVQGELRRQQVHSYEARLEAARQAVSAGARQGHRLFHVASGIQDLDLAVKATPELSGVPDLLVLCDVPASFVVLPETPRARARLSFLLARPPLPPSGAYAFGGRRLAGLARRGDDPDISEVVARLPELRFIRLYESGSGAARRVAWRDVTDRVVSDASRSSPRP